MNNHELEGIMRKLIGNLFGGVWASDELEMLNREHFYKPVYYIVNTHPSHMPGEHWLALTLENEDTGTFFDSLGNRPDYFRYPDSIVSFFKKNNCRVIRYNTLQLQHEDSVTCGQHCVFYLTHRGCGLSFNNVIKLYHDNVFKNDKMVQFFVKKYRKNISPNPCVCFKQSAKSLNMCL